MALSLCEERRSGWYTFCHYHVCSAKFSDLSEVTRLAMRGRKRRNVVDRRIIASKIGTIGRFMRGAIIESCI